MQLDRYLDWIVNTLDSRRDADLESFRVEVTEPGRQALIEGRLRFWDDSLLKFVEVIQQRGALVGKLEYTYHYQDQRNRLIFRYDNVPHHRDIATFPHHKHVAALGSQIEGIEPSSAPQLSDIIHEIEQFLYPNTLDI